MKPRLTPLNFVTAFFIILAVYVWIYGASITGQQFANFGGIVGGIFMLFAFVVSFMDLMFRNFFPELKKIWVIEISFIILAVAIFLMVR